MLFARIPGFRPSEPLSTQDGAQFGGELSGGDVPTLGGSGCGIGGTITVIWANNHLAF